jgi:predicted porin
LKSLVPNKQKKAKKPSLLLDYTNNTLYTTLWSMYTIILKGTLMTKTIIAAALLATATVVSAQTTLYGRMNATIDNTKTGTATARGFVNDISHIGVAVREDLGQGLSVRARVETSIAAQDPVSNNTTQLGDRQSTVGIANKFGSVDLGRNVHGVFTTLADGDAFSALYGSIVGDVHNLRGLRVSNGIFARVNAGANIVGGVDRTMTPSGDEVNVYSAGGKFGPVAGGVAHYEQGNEKSTVAAAVFGFANTRLFYSHSDNSGVVKSKGDMVGASQRMGAYTLKGSYGRTNTDITAWVVGAEYALSKRTDMLVSYRNVDKVATKNDVKQIGVGITHRF